MATTKSSDSFKNLTAYLKKLKELDDTAVKNSSLVDELKKSTLFGAATSKQQPAKVEDKKVNADLAIQLAQLKTEKDIKEDEDKGDILLSKINDTLKDIKKALQGNTPEKKVGGGPGRSDTSPGALPKADNLTFTEKLKSAVAGVKGAGNKVMGLGEKVVGATTGAVEGLISDPKGFAKNAFGSLKGAVTSKANSIGKYVTDVVKTKADYTPEQERFATAFSQTSKGGLMQGKKTGKEVGAEVYNKLKAKQEEIDKQKEVLRPFEEQGFSPKEKTKDLEKLQNQFIELDPRVQKEEKQKREAKVSSKKESNVSEQALAASNPNADNVESSSEKISKEITENNKTISSLLTISTNQLTSLNVIKDALVPANPKEQEAKGQKPREPDIAPAPAAESGSMLGDIASAAGGLLSSGKGIGGKVLGGLGKAAKFLGPAAAVAGAAYSGAQGYQNTNQNFDLKEGEEATVGQKTASTLGGVASGLTFGLLDEKSAAQGIHKVGSAIGDFFSGKKESKLEENSGYDVMGNQTGMSTAGTTMTKASTENADMEREANKGAGGGNTVVSNNVSSNNTTKFVPMKASPRPESQGSALDRYQNRITSF